jgi:hypothetical protein
MHSMNPLGVFVLVSLLSPAISAQQTPQPAPSTQPATPESAPPTDGPSYRARPLPTDTFKPSERVSEDYPVAFPADI